MYTVYHLVPYDICLDQCLFQPFIFLKISQKKMQNSHFFYTKARQSQRLDLFNFCGAFPHWHFLYESFFFFVKEWEQMCLCAFCWIPVVCVCFVNSQDLAIKRSGIYFKDAMLPGYGASSHVVSSPLLLTRGLSLWKQLWSRDTLTA